MRIRRLDCIAILMLLEAAFNVLLRPPLRRLPSQLPFQLPSNAMSLTLRTSIQERLSAGRFRTLDQAVTSAREVEAENVGLGIDGRKRAGRHETDTEVCLTSPRRQGIL